MHIVDIEVTSPKRLIMRHHAHSEYKVLLTKKYLILELFGFIFFITAIIKQM